MTPQTVGGFSFDVGVTNYLQDGVNIPMTWVLFRQGRLPDNLLDQLPTSFTWDLLTRFFHNSNEPSQRLKSLEDWNPDALDFQWVLPPSRNHHSGSFYFYLSIQKESNQWMYFKILFPTNEGFLAIEILGEHNDSRLQFAKKMIEYSTLTEAFEEQIDEQVPMRTSRWGELLLLPSDRQETPSNATLMNQSYLEQNRKSAGLLFLALSVAFFIFVAPKITK